MSFFLTAKQLASWAGVCPGNHESAGIRLQGTIRPANSWFRTVLIEAAHAAARTKHTSLSAQYHRIAARRGAKKATIAVAHTMIVIISHFLTEGTTYHELGANYFDERDRQKVQRRLVQRLEQLGYSVDLTPTHASDA